MIPQETVTRILDTAQISDVVGDFVTLRRRGANLVACCPFHNEKTPSFYVSPAKGIYKCFGCGKSGTAVGFVMEHESLTYVEALKYLAKRYGIEVVEKEESAEEIAAKQRSESLYLVSEFAGKFFQEALKTQEGHSLGYQYFKSRGLEDETIRKYGLGWAPSGRSTLSDAARNAGYKEEFLIDTGLSKKNDNGTLSDRFYNRVIFPIHSVSGRVIAFGGRTLEGGHPAMKYVNSPETEIYVKSNSLYGIYFAKNEISRRDKCYLVEGYLDVLSMHQLGITNVVASSGTSLTVPQIRLIKKFTENITIMYDGDKAGINAALRGIGLILKEGMNVKVVLIPDGDDPDSYSRKHSLEEVETFIHDNEKDFITFKSNLLAEDAGDDPIKRAEMINDIADTISLIPDAVKRTVYVQTCSHELGIDDDLLFDRIRKTREKMLSDEKREAERAESRQSRSEDAVSQVVEPAPVKNTGLVFEKDALVATERELLWFILKYGLDVLEFETDSEFYDPENQYTVAEFISSAIEEDGNTLENSIFRKIYETYFGYYDDESLSQQDIIKKIMDSEDRQMADVTSSIVEEPYLLTVKNFEVSMTSVPSMLVRNIPRAILVYHSKRLQEDLKSLKNELKNADIARQMEILKELQEKANIRKTIDNKLGRVL